MFCFNEQGTPYNCTDKSSMAYAGADFEHLLCILKKESFCFELINLFSTK